jgi:multimeric flavodoxin WrbA
MPSKNTKIVSGRIPKEMEYEIPVSRILTDVYRLLKNGNLMVKDGGLEASHDSVEDTHVNYCDGCEYMENALDMSKFNEVCEYKGLDRQRALDRCAQMLWR